MFATIVLTVIATLFVVLVTRNLSTLEKQLEHRIEPDFHVGDPQFERVMGTLMGPAILEGNQITVLKNGKNFFPVMLEAIRGAQKTITLETFIFWSGEVGRHFTDAVIKKAEEGVAVHVIVDWLGSWKMDRELVDILNNSKVDFQRFRPPGMHNLAIFNNRTHRKILVIDGKLAFTGGAGIADAWDGDAADEKHWRDNQYQLQGPCVAQMQSAFMDNWVQVSQQVLVREEYYPELKPEGEVRAHVFMSGAGSGSESARLMYLISIASARKNILLGQGYFVPDRLSIKSLVGARERGVRVQIIVAGPIDSPIVRRCSRSLWGPLLEAGVEIYQYTTARYHCKMMVVDDCWVSVGSTNFDTRSFRLNDEVNLSALDTALAEELTAHFEEDKKCCHQVTLEEWNSRPATMKLIDNASALLRAQL